MSEKPTHYKTICLSLYTRDILLLDAQVAELKRRGHTRMNKSMLVRIALAQLDLDKAARAPEMPERTAEQAAAILRLEERAVAADASFIDDPDKPNKPELEHAQGATP